MPSRDEWGGPEQLRKYTEENMWVSQRRKRWGPEPWLKNLDSTMHPSKSLSVSGPCVSNYQ